MSAPANGKAARRLESFKRLLAHIRELLSLDFGFVLWDGSTVPADLPSNALAIVFADEGVVAAMLRRPNADTFLNLWVTARIDIRNGVIFDFLARQPKLRTKEIRRRLDKRLALTTALKFLFVPRGGPWPLEAIRDHEARRDGSEETNKENVHYHYDLSNAFYALFLDPEMVYSCAYFRDWNNDLATAQHDKLDMICRKLRLKPGDRLLDIGCGWGALVCHAAKHFGVDAVGVTLAEEQFAYAKEKVSRLGLENKVTIELRDYSLIEGDFDKIASIGMFEHVGVANYPAYFQTIHRLLKPGGLYLHHSIALRSAAYERLRREEVSNDHRDSALHLPGRRPRSSRHVDCQSGALRLRGARCRGVARALRAHHPALARSPFCQSRGRGARGRRREDPAMDSLSRRRLDRLHAKQRRHLSDARLEARARAIRSAAVARASLSLTVVASALPPVWGQLGGNSYTDGDGPDASREMMRFFLKHRLGPTMVTRNKAA